MECNGKTKNNCEILVVKRAGRGPLKDQRLDLNGDVDGRHETGFICLCLEVWRAVVIMVMKLGHLCKCQLF